LQLAEVCKRFGIHQYPMFMYIDNNRMVEYVGSFEKKEDFIDYAKGSSRLSDMNERGKPLPL
jgi:hypothetical protein